MQSFTQTASAPHALFQSTVSLPREHLAAIQHIITDALALQSRGARPPPPPYNASNSNSNLTPPRDSSLWFKPRMDLYQSSSVSGARPLVTATFELPGLRKDDIHIDVLDNHMIVAGDRSHLSALEGHTRNSEMKDFEATKNAGGEAESGISPSNAQDTRSAEVYTVREIKRGRFKRVVPLPAGTKLEDVKASMHDGILTITFPGAVRPVPQSIHVD